MSDKNKLCCELQTWQIDHLVNHTVTPKARSIVRTLLPKYTLDVVEDNGMGMAYMNHDLHIIGVNIEEYIRSIDPYWNKIPSTFTKFEKSEIFSKVFLQGFLGLICHEIGHALYTLPSAEVEKLKPDNMPESFVHFCVNVVEDSYIQNKMKERFKWNLLRDSLDTSTALFQGLTTCEDFAKQKKFTTFDKLFYFILRSYNKHFLPPEGCDIPEDLITEFLSFYYANDNVERCKATISWSTKVYAWLKDELEKESSQQSGKSNSNSGGTGSGSSTSDSSSSSDSSTDSDSKDGSSTTGNPSVSGNSAGTGPGTGKGKQSSDVDKAIEDLVDKLVKKTGIGSGDKDTQGQFDANELAKASLSEMISLSSGIGTITSSRVEPLSSTAREMLKSFNLHFHRLQLHTFNGTSYNQTSGRLDQAQIYKSGYTPCIFTRDLARKRDMDLYVGVALDVSGSMDWMFSITRDITVSLMHSLVSINANCELLTFDDDTHKVKDYSSRDLSKLYASTRLAQTGGCTDLLPTLEYYSSIIRVRNHKDKCLIVITDGETGNGKECLELITKLRQQGVHTLGISICDSSSKRQFKALFGTDKFIYDTEEDVKQKLAADLTTYLSNKFMRR